jgi:protein-tyrosine phosphatase
MDSHILASLINFRDVGGLALTEGGVVRQQVLCRSATVACMPVNSRHQLYAYGIRTCVDLRRPAEIAEQGGPSDIPGVQYVNIELFQEPWPVGTFTTTAERAAYLADCYLDMAATGRAGIAEIVRIVADPARSAVLLHCSAGRDRTGVVMALTLALAGVSDQAIAADYERSNDEDDRFTAYYDSIYSDSGPDDWPAGVVVAPSGAIDLFLRGLRGRYGSISGYAAYIGLSDVEVRQLRRQLADIG